MKKSKAISLLLCLSLLASLLIPGTLAMPAKAAEGGTDNGMKVNKTAVANDNGTYTITLEAYATGEKIISEVKKDVPTDIVLVLDQSGSMADDIGTVSFEAYSADTRNSAYYSNRHNGGSGKLYYRLEDGSYASVSVTMKETVGYKEITSGRNNSSWNGATNYWNNRENLIAYVNEEPVVVTVTRSRDYFWEDYEYTYTLPNGDVIATITGDYSTPTFKGVDGNCLYLKAVDTTKTVYTYSYTDASGNVHTIETSTGANGTIKTKLYQRIVSTNGGGSRLNALKSAVTTFANSVDAKAKGQDTQYGTDDDVNHRIAVVSFADYASNLTNGFIDMDKANGLTSVTSAVNGLRADGNTYPAAGIKEANNIFSKNSIESGKRNRVIVLFTDGYPAPAGTDDIDYVWCDNAISSAYTSKHNYGATVYTVAIFSGANPNSDIDSNYERDSINATKQLVAANRYMHYTSSNYPDARSMENGGSKAKDGYYLSAADADTLNNIFQKISDQIESGGSSTTLSSETVIKDIIADQFTLPEDATASDITLETYSCTGKNSSGYTWQENNDSMDAVATVDGSQVSVTGFDFAGNYVGTVTENGKVSYRGNKLVITFQVEAKDGFLGGNNVYTNASAGVYENSSATSPVMEFNRPQVNVPINNVTVTAENKNVYLLSDLTAEQIKSGATVKCGDVELKLNESNYGLEKWQTEYVDIAVEIKGKDGNVLTDLTDLTELKDDTIYTITATVKPKAGLDGKDAAGTRNSMDGESDTKRANILVFTPELTFKDSEVYYGDTAPTDFSGNKTSEVWKHGETVANPDTMIGTAPELVISYTPEDDKIENGKVNTKQDIAVGATVEIDGTDVTGYTTFQHTNCTDKQCGTPAKGKFWLHVKTCQLTIAKTGCEDIDENQSFIFDVTGPNGYSQRVVIKENDSVTIKDLPIDTYTITEVSSWSWRYSANGQKVTLQPGVTNEVTVQNKRNLIYWLNGCGYAQNIFG